MSTYYTSPPTVIDGDIAYATDVNSINTETDTGFSLVYDDVSAMEGTVSAWATLAQKWAENPEDSEVTSGTYSALHWAAKSESYVSSASSYAIQSQNYSIAAAVSASTAGTEATSATASAATATTKATAAATSATSAATSATASEASAVRAESAAVDNASDIAALTAVVSTNTGNISDNTFDISLHETRILANTSDIAINTSNIGDLEAATYITNFLVNGNFTVNQRNFDGVWATAAAAEYGYDRWCKYSSTHIEQIIMEENIPSGTYTLSWVDGGSGLSGSVNGTAVANGGSTIVTTTGNVSVTVPNDATEVQLEQGGVAHSFSYVPYEETLDRCLYYGQYVEATCRFHAASPLHYAAVGVNYRRMRGTPTASVASSGSDANTSLTGLDCLKNISEDSLRFEVLSVTSGDCYVIDATYWLDAEIAGTGV